MRILNKHQKHLILDCKLRSFTAGASTETMERASKKKKGKKKNQPPSNIYFVVSAIIDSVWKNQAGRPLHSVLPSVGTTAVFGHIAVIIPFSMWNKPQS
jgi:hypothetical protein